MPQMRARREQLFRSPAIATREVFPNGTGQGGAKALSTFVHKRRKKFLRGMRHRTISPPRQPDITDD